MMQLIIWIITILCVILLTYKNDHSNKKISYFTTIALLFTCLLYLSGQMIARNDTTIRYTVVVLSLTLLTIKMYNKDLIEGMTTNEAVANVASIFNTDNMVVKNLKVTGNIEVAGDATLNGPKTTIGNITMTPNNTVVGGNVSIGGTTNIGGATTIGGATNIGGSVNIAGTLGGRTNADNLGVHNMTATKIGIGQNIYGLDGTLQLKSNVAISGSADVAEHMFIHRRTFFHLPGYYMSTQDGLPAAPFTKWGGNMN